MLSSKMIVALMFLFLGTIACEECTSALKGTSHSFIGKFKHELKEIVEVIWLRNRTPISMCNSKMACYDYSELTTMTSIRSLGDGMYSFSLTVHNVSDLDNGLWSMRYLGLASLRQRQPLFSCKLKVYASSVLTLQNCPGVVEEGLQVSCTCETKYQTQDIFSIGWYNKTVKLSTNDDHVITFTASRYMQGFECRGKTFDDKETLPLSYDPIVIAKPVKVECTAYYAKGRLNANCLIERIFPSAMCLFTIIGSKNKYHAASNYVLYDHKPNPKELLYYNTECRLQMPVHLTSGNYIVSLTVYPNVTDTESDKIYAVNYNFTFDYKMWIDYYNEEIMSVCLTSRFTFAVVCCLSSSMILLMMLFAVLRRLQKRKCTQKDKLTKDESDQRAIATLSKSYSKNSTLLTFPVFISTEKEFGQCQVESNAANVPINLCNDLMHIISNDQQDNEWLVVSDKELLLS